MSHAWLIGIDASTDLTEGGAIGVSAINQAIIVVINIVVADLIGWAQRRVTLLPCIWIDNLIAALTDWGK
jgi:hypothetical protein